jgi:electron transport complex protein RnfB
MHAVIEDDCTGCELCLPPCPVDCIDIIALPNRSASALPARQRTEVQMARTAFDARQQRLTLALKQKQEQQRQRQLESERIKARQLLEEALTRSRAKVRS